MMTIAVSPGQLAPPIASVRWHGRTVGANHASDRYRAVFVVGGPQTASLVAKPSNLRAIMDVQRFPNLRAELSQLGKLVVGWDGYDADPPNERSLRSALEVLAECERQGVAPNGIIADSMGGVAIEFGPSADEDSWHVTFDCLNSGSVVLVVETDDVDQPSKMLRTAAEMASAVTEVSELIQG